jgi:hypothetical protein
MAVACSQVDTDLILPTYKPFHRGVCIQDGHKVTYPASRADCVGVWRGAKFGAQQVMNHVFGSAQAQNSLREGKMKEFYVRFSDDDDATCIGPFTVTTDDDAARAQSADGCKVWGGEMVHSGCGAPPGASDAQAEFCSAQTLPAWRETIAERDGVCVSVNDMGDSENCTDKHKQSCHGNCTWYNPPPQRIRAKMHEVCSSFVTDDRAESFGVMERGTIKHLRGDAHAFDDAAPESCTDETTGGPCWGFYKGDEESCRLMGCKYTPAAGAAQACTGIEPACMSTGTNPWLRILAPRADLTCRDASLLGDGCGDADPESTASIRHVELGDDGKWRPVTEVSDDMLGDGDCASLLNAEATLTAADYQDMCSAHDLSAAAMRADVDKLCPAGGEAMAQFSDLIDTLGRTPEELAQMMGIEVSQDATPDDFKEAVAREFCIQDTFEFSCRKVSALCGYESTRSIDHLQTLANIGIAQTVALAGADRCDYLGRDRGSEVAQACLTASDQSACMSAPCDTCKAGCEPEDAACLDACEGTACTPAVPGPYDICSATQVRCPAGTSSAGACRASLGDCGCYYMDRLTKLEEDSKLVTASMNIRNVYDREVPYTDHCVFRPDYAARLGLDIGWGEQSYPLLDSAVHADPQRTQWLPDVRHVRVELRHAGAAGALWQPRRRRPRADRQRTLWRALRVGSTNGRRGLPGPQDTLSGRRKPARDLAGHRPVGRARHADNPDAAPDRGRPAQGR